ncbi:MAG TPA: hypothetical protein VGP24_06990 [Glaciihabitans sp.]|nr:hypothetical protein [Glaciihabitans sp.]
MPPSKESSERGSASLEFITAGVLLLVPLVYLILVISALQAATFAVEGAARQASRVFVRAPTEQDARDAANRAIAFALSDYGVEPARAEVSIACTPHPAECLTRRGYVTVTVDVEVSLPLVPAAISISTPLAVTVSASASQQVSRFWTGG